MRDGASPFRTLPLDRESERSVAALRLAAAGTVTLGALVIAIMRPPPAVWICVAVALCGSAVWLVLGLRTRRRIADAERHRLLLRPEGLILCEGAERRWLAWDEVCAVEVDEERLQVRAQAKNGADLLIEPRYGGLGAYDLEAAIRRAWEAGRTDAG